MQLTNYIGILESFRQICDNQFYSSLFILIPIFLYNYPFYAFKELVEKAFKIQAVQNSRKSRMRAKISRNSKNAIVKRESREQCGNRERENCVFAMSARKEYPKKSFKVLCIVLHTSYTYKKREDVGVLFTWRRKPNFFKNICLSEYHIQFFLNNCHMSQQI